MNSAYLSAILCTMLHPYQLYRADSPCKLAASIKSHNCLSPRVCCLVSLNQTNNSRLHLSCQLAALSGLFLFEPSDPLHNRPLSHYHPVSGQRYHRTDACNKQRHRQYRQHRDLEGDIHIVQRLVAGIRDS